MEEHRRLEALEALDIMDTEPEPEFDDIVFIASSICRTPVSLVSLVEKDRQWFKARVGFEACETPIGQSVCVHALASTDLLIIPDLLADPRTRENTLVTEPPHIRFYAGAPLVMSDGIVIGTLCVIDTAPRPEGLDEVQKQVLRALSRQVIAHLEARQISHRKDELFRRQKKISARIRAHASKTLAAQEAARIGTFEIDIETGTVTVSSEFCRVFDVAPADTYPTAIFENMLHPEDKGIQSHHLSRQDASALTEVEYRIITSHGVRWISRHATFHRDSAGKPLRLIGTVQDITVSKRAAARVQALLDLGDRLRNLDDTQSMASAAADLMAKALDATRAGFGIVNIFDETVDMQPEWRAPGIDSLVGTHHFRTYGSFINDLKLGQTVVIGDVTTDPRTKENAQALLDIGVRVLVNVPIFDHGNFSLVVFVHHDHPYEWTAEELAFVRSFGDRIQSAIANLRAEAEQDLLNREISHRLKNTFAMVQAIATQTLRPIAEREHVRNFEQRLQALSSAHDILLQDNWSSASLHSIIAGAAQSLGLSAQLDLQGPDVYVGSRGTLSFSLVLHELMTNAVKYGALSVPEGKIIVHWTIAGEREELTFSWKERGGPPASAPTSKGFGSKLIKMGLIGTGGVETSYDERGFSVVMTASLDQLQRET